MRSETKLLGAQLLVLFTLAGCSTGTDVGISTGAPRDASTPMPDDAGTDAADATTPIDVDASKSMSPDAAMSLASCEMSKCPSGQRCVITAGQAECVNAECSQLMCTATERCEAVPEGGHVCVDNSCSGDVNCATDSFCGDGICKADVCTAGVRHCDGQNVYECSANGGEDAMQFACQTVGYFDSQCSETSGYATCSCMDDWDCPAFTVCETGSCVGTGRAPTCSLPAVPFSSTPPAVKLFWGGASPDNNTAYDGTAAHNEAPWSNYGQVVNTPIVVNLDDDNGDGLVNELDFPEILFVSHQGDNHYNYGVVRAIHGGGPNKGADYFAICGSTLWTEGDPLPGTCVGPDADPGAPMAVGDLNNDGFPEIVYTTDDSKFRILDHTGQVLYQLETPYTLSGVLDSPSIANLDLKGYAEIVLGNIVYVLGEGPSGGITVTHVLKGTASIGTAVDDGPYGTMACVADLISSSPGLEIVAGATLYKLPQTLPTCGTPPCTGSLDIVWNAKTVAGNSGLSGEGFCAVADVWGADSAQAPGPDNPPDGMPEVVLIDQGDLTILDGQTGKIIQDSQLGGGIYRGGAPNVDDFDGDGYMEVASALENDYVVVDLQASTGTGGSCPDWPTPIARNDLPNGAHNPNPARTPGGSCKTNSDCDPAAMCNTAIGQCVCLHNGWKRDSDDSSSAATSSSVFDFNGDGAAEVLYNDECQFRVYNGLNGEVLFSHASRSRTGTENPVVADVDNDGNAEVVTGINVAVDRCNDDLIDPNTTGAALADPNSYNPTGPNGLRVWGDPSDTWAAARRIWNQQSYHVTNITESGAVPPHEPESWKAWDGHKYNTYRSQPRGFGVAPDLIVAGVGVSSPDAQCGSLTDNIDIAFEIANIGDLRVGPGVVVSFFGTWDGSEQALKDTNGDPLEIVLAQSLEPGKSTIQKVNFAHSYNAKDILPSKVRVVVDPQSDGHANGSERECREDNNDKSAAVDPGSLRADLTVELLSIDLSCPNANVETKVRNIGTADAKNVVVRYYAGDPAQGGTPLYDEVLSDPVPANGEATVTAAVPLLPGRNITIYAVVDPDKKIEECGEANNADNNDMKVYCEFSPQ